jgi:hypothetical protein
MKSEKALAELTAFETIASKSEEYVSLECSKSSRQTLFIKFLGNPVVGALPGCRCQGETQKNLDLSEAIRGSRGSASLHNPFSQQNTAEGSHE